MEGFKCRLRLLVFYFVINITTVDRISSCSIIINRGWTSYKFSILIRWVTHEDLTCLINGRHQHLGMYIEVGHGFAAYTDPAEFELPVRIKLLQFNHLVIAGAKLLSLLL